MSAISRPLTIVLISLSAGYAFGAEVRRKTPTADIPAERFYKNIQVFKGLPSTDLMPAMKFMADSLGVKCSHCHVINDTGRWPVELDDKAPKGRAREMIRMVREINRANFKGRLEVTCATCHHGSKDPASMPPLAAEAATVHPESSPEKPEAPTIDALLEKYLSASGGKEAIARIRNRRIRGTFIEADGEAHPIEVDLTASGMYRSSVTVKDGSFTMVFDGTKGTTGGPTWKNPMMPDEMERMRARATLFPAADLKAKFPVLAVRGKETVGGKAAWMVVARDSAGRRATFWFDAESGLLLRSELRQTTALGDIPEETEYSDYRPADGVVVPFTIRHTAPDRTDSVAATELLQNVTLDDSLFAVAAP